MCDESYPFYIKNTGKEFGISNEDIQILPVWEKGFTGNNISIRFFINGFNPDHISLKQQFLQNLSFNFDLHVSDVSFESIENVDRGTALISIACSNSKGSNNIYGIAPNSSFSVSILSQKYFDLESFLHDFSYFNDSEDIIVDASTFDIITNFRKYYIKKYVSTIDSFLKNFIDKGRNGKGKIFLISNEKIPKQSKKASIFEDYTSAFLISTSDYIGGEGYSPLFSAATLINCPSFGNTNPLQFDYPQIPAASVYSLYKGRNTSQISSHLSIAAGAISLLLEVNKNLIQRDILWILALSSSQNDPLHPSWVANRYNLKYSALYGFGRINCTRMMEIGLLWNNKTLSKLFTTECESQQELPLFIPCARNGKLEVNFSVNNQNFDLNSTSGCIESVLFQFNLSYPDISMLRIILQSPSNTKIEILRPDPFYLNNYTINDQYLEGNFNILVRGFMGEPVTGIWKAIFIDSSFIQDLQLTNVKIIFNYMNDKPKISSQHISETSTSQYPLDSYDDKIKLDFSFSSVICGTNFSGLIKTKEIDQSNVFAYIEERNSGRTLPTPFSINGENIETIIPCIFPDKFHIYFTVQNRKENAFATKDLIIYHHDNISGFISPFPYQSFDIKSKSHLSINLTLYDNRMDFPPNGMGSSYVISLYDLDTNTKIITKEATNIPLNDEFLIQMTQKKSFKGMLVAVAVEQFSPDPCNTYVIPLIFNEIDEETNTSQNNNTFIVPLNDFCPIPDGIINKLPPKPTNPSKPFITTPIGTSLVILIILLISCIFLLILFYLRKRNIKKEISFQLDDQMLL